MRKNILLYILIGILILGLGTYLFLKSYFKSSNVERRLSQRIEKTVHEATGGLYKIYINKTEVDIDNLSVTLRDIHFAIDSSVLKTLRPADIPANTVDIVLKKLEIKNVDAYKLLTEKGVDLRKILLDDATIKMYHFDSVKKKTEVDTTIKITTLYDKINKDISSIRIDTLSLHNASFAYYGTNQHYKETDVNRISADLFNVLIDSTTRGNTDRFLYSSDARIYVDSFSMPLSKAMYKLSLAKLYVQIKGKTITTIKDLKLHPLYDKDDFAKHLGHQIDRFDIRAPEFTMDNFDYSEFLNNRSILADKILLSDAHIEVYQDRTAPPNNKSKVGGYPHQLLSKLDVPVRVPYIKVQNATVAYKEKSADTKKVGVISFTKVNGDINNLSNIEGSGVMNIAITARFMGEAPLDAHFVFPNNPANGEFKVSGKFGAFDGKILNQVTIPLGEVKINSANIKLLSFNMTANDTRSNGKITFLYDNVDIEMLKRDTSSPTGFKKRGFITFLANKILLKKKNKANDNRPDVVNVQYERDVTKSMFNLIWKTIFYGIKEQVGAGGMGKDKERATVK
ncbi:hypothetical protein [Pinibacter soli]|uniref:DUF748 domain-containing protein n=1 Tax=Pinibacter soli TaxID=3044211 RepID=A0ABT6RDQ9_9BACT|nr:hypothetical protein [Pinibacter soli]MDI3320709.1 hypothetical protein [Pinibacter soli]